MAVQQDEGSLESYLRGRTGPQLIGMYSPNQVLQAALALLSSTINLFPRASDFPPMILTISPTPNPPKASYPMTS